MDAGLTVVYYDTWDAKLGLNLGERSLNGRRAGHVDGHRRHARQTS